MDMVDDLLDGVVADCSDEKTFAEDWDLEKLNGEISRLFAMQPQLTEDSLGESNQEDLRETLSKLVLDRYAAREEEFGEKVMRELESYVLLQNVDSLWKDHLLNMDHLKEGIGLRGYGQQDPLVAYKREGHALFDDMIERVKEETVRMLFHIQIQREEQVQQLKKEQEDQPMFFGPAEGGGSRPPVVRKDGKVGRNDPCPCGSGKKYKKCCGK